MGGQLCRQSPTSNPVDMNMGAEAGAIGLHPFLALDTPIAQLPLQNRIAYEAGIEKAASGGDDCHV